MRRREGRDARGPIQRLGIGGSVRRVGTRWQRVHQRILHACQSFELTNGVGQREVAGAGEEIRRIEILAGRVVVESPAFVVNRAAGILVLPPRDTTRLWGFTG